MNGRVYDPRLGRFLSADPFIKSAENLQTFNRYAYVQNNPLNAVDPSGYTDWYLGLSFGASGFGVDFGYSDGNSSWEYSGSNDYWEMDNQEEDELDFSPGRQQEFAYDRYSWLAKTETDAVKETPKIRGNGGLAGLPVNEHSVCQGGCHGIDYRGRVYADDSDLVPLYIAGGIAASVGPGFIASSSRTTLVISEVLGFNYAVATDGMPFLSRINGAKGTNSSVMSSRKLIIDENLSPKVLKTLKEQGHNVKTFPKGTLDPDIISYAQKTNSIVVTNNIKDFKNQGITTFEVSSAMTVRSETDSLVSRINRVLDTDKNYPGYFSSTANVKLDDYGI